MLGVRAGARRAEAAAREPREGRGGEIPGRRERGRYTGGVGVGSPGVSGLGHRGELAEVHGARLPELGVCCTASLPGMAH